MPGAMHIALRTSDIGQISTIACTCKITEHLQILAYNYINLNHRFPGLRIILVICSIGHPNLLS